LELRLGGGVVSLGERRLYKSYFDAELAHALAGKIKAVEVSFPDHAFVERVTARVDGLEMRDRVTAMADALWETLPKPYPRALDVLVAILGPELPTEDGMFKHGYWLMPVARFVELHGLDHFGRSMGALYEITKRHTAEYAVRPFIERYPEQALGRLHGWVSDASAHVRRLVSEGTRPRLPWASRLQVFVEDPSPVLGLLERLKDDPSRFVQRSVANNLNDIMKDHPALAMGTIERWHAGAGAGRQWIIRHALRNRVRQGDPVALRLLGYQAPEVALEQFSVDPVRIGVGQELTCRFRLASNADAEQKLLIDYRVHYVRRDGSTMPRVFRVGMRVLEAGGEMMVEKRHAMRPVSGRGIFPGEHRLEVQVNGIILAAGTFDVEL
jgi:3-methyladenine DNA glycosylase AlkC